MPGSDDNKRQHSIDEIENWNLDRSTDAPTKVTGIMGRTSAGSWVYLGSDAGQFRVSALGVNVSDVSNADAADFRMSAFSNDGATLRVSALTASLDATNSVDKVEQQFSYYYISANGVFLVKSGAAFLHTVAVNTRGTGSTFTIWDNIVSAGATAIAKIDTTVTTNAFLYDMKLATGLTVSANGAGAADITVTYR